VPRVTDKWTTETTPVNTVISIDRGHMDLYQRSRTDNLIINMSFPNNLLSNSTWQRLGLGTSTLVLGLGFLSMVAPTTAGSSLGVTGLTTSEGLAMNVKAMQFLGIRDIVVGGALFWFHRERNQKASGVLQIAWVLVCVTGT
jgi:hypothetical protein